MINCFSWIPSSRLWRNCVGHWHRREALQSCSSKDFLLCSPVGQKLENPWFVRIQLDLSIYNEHHSSCFVHSNHTADEILSDLQWRWSGPQHTVGKRPQRWSSFLQCWPRSQCPTCSPVWDHKTLFFVFFLLFSCPQQLNRWPCHSVSHSLTHWRYFYFWHYRVTPETCDLLDIWSEWWGDMTWLKNTHIPTYPFFNFFYTLKERS